MVARIGERRIVIGQRVGQKRLIAAEPIGVLGNVGAAQAGESQGVELDGADNAAVLLVHANLNMHREVSRSHQGIHARKPLLEGCLLYTSTPFAKRAVIKSGA